MTVYLHMRDGVLAECYHSVTQLRLEAGRLHLMRVGPDMSFPLTDAAVQRTVSGEPIEPVVESFKTA